MMHLWPATIDSRTRGRLAVGLLLGWLACSGRQGAAQQPWDYAPYRIQVWTAFDSAAELPEQFHQRIAASLVQRAEVLAGPTWDLQAEKCPAELRGEVLVNWAAPSVDAVKAVAPDLLKQKDKLVLLRLDAGANEFSIQARELDCVTRQWSRSFRHTAVAPEQIPDACLAVLADAFTPLGRIDAAASGEVRVRVRAAGLIPQEPSIVQIRDTDVLLPVFRCDDRQGEPQPNGIQIPPWTFLTVTQREGTALNCEVRSGISVAFDSPSAARARKYALVVKPTLEATVLCVQSQGKTPQPLGGYEVSMRDIDNEAVEVIGKTDWRGMVRIPKTDKPLRMIYVRNAGQLLARLPLVPGLDAEATAKVINDDPRLLAEGYLKGLQNHVMDLVATRQLYLVRFRRLLEKQEFEQARRLLEEFRRLETRTDLGRQLDQQQQRMACPDRRVQLKIDKLFSDTRQLLAKFLDPYTANTLAQDLARAERAAGASGKPTAKPQG
jgi:hypothetical protein